MLLLWLDAIEFILSSHFKMPSNSHSQEEPIAICGLALKFPQDASTEDGFWTMLLEKRSTMTEFPPERLNVNAFYHPTRRNALRTRGAHFIKEDLGLFDANFFSITPTEASAMDPMQRILLETTFKAFENAGIRLEDVKGSRSSVHTGCFTNDYLQQILKDSERLPPYAAVGATQSMLANRLSWFFDLRGPSVNLDSACSSSGMAVDLSCQLLHRGITDMGVVAGCNILLDPDFSTVLSNMQMLSPDSRCFTFDQRANGYSRGEGVAVVVLKRLSDALRSNDTIRAIIRSSGTNQDGRTPGITQPDPKAQAQLIRETYQQAGLSMMHTRFFEAHGTGTAIGDPIEMSAIAECFHEHRNFSDPLYVGSVKTNIGHLEGASGIAGLIKATLVVESGVIPPNANFESINRKLASYDYMVSLPSECISWPPCEVRRASINSFGYGGTNSHIVIDDVFSYLKSKGLSANFAVASRLYGPTESPLCSSAREEYPKLLVWSASTDTAVRAMVSAWEKFCSRDLDTTRTPSISDIAYTLGSRRSSLLSKSFAVVSNSADLGTLTQLSSAPIVTPKQAPRLAFVFTGQGAQWYAMGRELFIYPEFAESIRVSESILATLGCSWSLQCELLKGEKESLVDRPDIAQTLTAVVQMGLVDLLKSSGVSPVAVVGHSMGEIAAAYCAEFLTRESALRVAYYRGIFTATIPEKSPMKGAMLAVALSAKRVSAYLDNLPGSTNSRGTLVVSCINSPGSTTVSGEESEIENLKHILDSENIFARRLRVPVAYHSHQMYSIVFDCLRHFTALESPKSVTEIKMVSSVTGTILTKEMACEGTYWTANLVSPVLFSQAVERLCRDSVGSLRKKIDGSHREALVVDTLVEIGPHAALRLPIQEIIESIPRRQEIKYLSALYRKQSASVTLLRLLGQLHCYGVPVDLRHVNDPDPYLRGSRVSLVDAPEYPFDHSTKYWSESPLVQNYRLRAHGHVELLGSPSRDWNPLEPQWRCCVQVSDMPWLLDHKLNGRAIYPASAMIVMAMQGASQILDRRQKIIGFTLRNVRYESAIAVSADSTDLETRLQLRPLNQAPASRDPCWNFSVHSVVAGHWTENCSGIVQVHHDSESWIWENRQKSKHYKRKFEARNEDCNDVSDSSAIYNNFNKYGFHYGSSFQGITKVSHNGTNTVTASLRLDSPLSESTSSDSFIIHPGTLDSFLHLALLSLRNEDKGIPTQAVSRISKLWISAEGLHPSHESVQASARFEGETPRTKLYSGFALTDNKEKVKLVLEGLQTTVIASIGKPEQTVGHDQFWCGIETAVDVDALSGTEIIKRLDFICGPDPFGPSEFFCDLRLYLHLVVRKLRSSIRETGIDPTKPYFERYVDWMDWCLGTPIYNPREISENSLRLRIKNEDVLGNFFLKVADNALGILQGSCDMVQLIFEDNIVEDFYEQLLARSKCFQKLRSYMSDLSFKYPNMDFLEIGAGTGSFTEHILKAVASTTAGAKERFHSYHYTDISPAYFERARERFSDNAHKLKFDILDAEQDPLDQGFKERSFDVISASNVLHVTSNLDSTLHGLRKLLRTGGKLLLHEFIHSPERIEVGFVFGLLPGWWPNTDDSRRMSPLLSEETWDTLLRRNGFSGADFILRDFSDEESHLMSLICTTAIEPEAANSVLPDVTIAVEPGSSTQNEMADVLISRLSAEGCHAVRVYLSTPQEIISSPGVLITLFDVEEAILSRLDTNSFESLKSLLLSASRILWVSKKAGPSVDPRHGMVVGFARVFRIENINSKLATLTLETSSEPQTDYFSQIISAFKQLLKAEGFDQPEDYTVQDGALKLSRIHEHIEFKTAISEILSGEKKVTQIVKDAKPFRVTLQQLGTPLSMRITEDDLTSGALGPDEVEIEIHAISLNLIDFSVLSGKTSETSIGRECAGIVTRASTSCDFTPGDRVCAYGSDVFGSTSRARRNHVAKIPQTLSFTEASTLPQDYIIANYIAREVRIQHDDLVVVRGGDTRLGRATLDVLKKYTPKLFATTSAAVVEEPSLYDGITRFTEGCFAESFGSCFPTGASVVLDFINTGPLQLTECVSRFGQILSIRTDSDDSSVAFNSFELPPTIGFKIVSVAEVLQHQPERLEMLHSQFDGLSAVHPFKVKTIDLSSIESIAPSVRGLGPDDRIAIEYDDQSEIHVYQPSKKETLFDPFSSYVISGGLGDLGRCIATWMVSRGARNLILLSRSGPRSEAAKSTIRDLENLGARVNTPLCNVADSSSLQNALQQLQDMPAIKGCVQAAGALKDILYEKMSFEDWKIAVDPKTRGSWNLHELLPKGLDFFILTSSISGIVGQATQINYAAGNTYQDALARYRLANGEKAVSLDLGLLATGGLLSQNEGLAERLAAENVYTLHSEAEVLSLFEYFCDPGLDIDKIPPQIVSGIINPSIQRTRGTDLPPAFSHPLWSQTLTQKGSNGDNEANMGETIKLVRSLADAGSAVEMSEIVADALADQVCSLVLAPKSSINLEEPLHAAGADSLSAVYLRNWIMKQFAVDVAIFDILGDMSIIALGNFIASEWQATRASS
ncbi:hypothetical protein F4804DRAFT_69463 [Jackrogersella minutella]|nr:hypothetical protein F4804DRAFT_69463 [Jackrogersella minutella]